LISAAVVSAFAPPLLGAAEESPSLYTQNFENAPLDKLPPDLMVLSGEFAVKAGGGNKFLELPGAPLDTFGVLFGPAGQSEISARAKFQGTKQGRKFPTFGISLNGVAGYRLQINPARKALELLKNDETKAHIDFAWPSGEWIALRLQVKRAGAKWRIEGKAWRASEPEPPAWMIAVEEDQEPSSGRAGVWGMPFSGQPIRFDDLTVAHAAP
jgi:hypothetical protein